MFYNEAKFLKEWLDYHLVIGVSHFYLYNNNSTDDYLEVLDSYIKNGTVTLIDYPDSPAQPFVYQHCLENYKDETRWLGFIDADEFVCPLYKDNIVDWLSDYKNYPCVNIKWKVFGTGGKMEHDYSRLVIEQYFLCEKSLNHLGKYFLNTRYQITKWAIHYPRIRVKIFNIWHNIPSITQYKHFIHSIGINKRPSCQINHYYTKSYNLALDKTLRRDVYYSDIKRSVEKIYNTDLRCTDTDFSILRFVSKLKSQQTDS